MTKQYKPFDLQRALAGDKFVRKHDLAEPIEWHYFSTASHLIWPLHVVFDESGNIDRYSIAGVYKANGNFSDDDLVMLSKTKKVFINVKKIKFDGNSAYLTSYAYEYKNELSMDNPSEWQIVEVEIEVND